MVVAIMATLLMMAIGIALILATTTETLISSSFRHTYEARYAADAIVERAIDDLVTVPDWTSVLDGSARAAFVDGAATGTRTLADGSTIDLKQLVNMANCQKSTPCTAADINQITADRPWGADNPRWTLFAHGSLQDIIPGGDTIRSPFYVLLLAGNDPAGTGMLVLRAEAYGPRGSHQVIEVTVARTSGIGIDPVQTPGKPRSDATLVKSVVGERAMAPFIADRHLVFGAGRRVAVVGEPDASNNGWGRAGVRIVSWREIR